MKHLSGILFQVDEACRFIEDGRQEPLRVALLLLDNAAELQMDRAIRTELGGAEAREKLRALALEVPDGERSGDLQRLIDWQPLTRKQKAQIDHNFNDKVDFLTSFQDKLDAAIQGPLKYLHRYRNQAYHRGTVRRATLAIACRLLVEINCELLLPLGLGGRSRASDEDYSWIAQRFGVRGFRILDRNFLERVSEEMRRRVLLDSSTLGATLADHLEARITDLQNAIAFVLEKTRDFSSPAEVFRASQYRAVVNRGEAPAAPVPPAAYEPRFGVQILDELLIRRAEIPATTARIDAFRTYSVLEATLELFEDDVHSMASEVDRAIQWAVDIAVVSNTESQLHAPGVRVPAGSLWALTASIGGRPPTSARASGVPTCGAAPARPVTRDPQPGSPEHCSLRAGAAGRQASQRRSASKNPPTKRLVTLGSARHTF